MSIEKVYLTASPDGKLSIGNQVIELKDVSRLTFSTDNLLAFEKFVALNKEEANICYSAKSVSLMPKQPEKAYAPIAICALQDSEALIHLNKALDKDLSIAEFEKLLYRLRRYGDFLSTISHLRSFSVAKKQTYERDVDNSGNFRLLIQREAMGVGNWVPPEKLSFVVPVFTYLQDAFKVDLDLLFSVTDAGIPVFRLENLTFAEDLLARRIEVLDARLSSASTCPQYWGVIQNVPMDDSWMYRENKANL